jgi:MFS superfamily sulfate permease-like transporter
LFFPGLVRNLPQAALAAILIVAAVSLLDLVELRRFFAVSRSEFVLAVVCALGVIFIGVLQGIVVAVLLSILQLFLKAWRPAWTVLGREPAGLGFHDLEHTPMAQAWPGILILRWNAPLMFANASVFRDLVRDLLAKSEEKPRWVVIAAEPITDLDTTAADTLRDLDLELNAQGIHLAFAELQPAVQERLRTFGLHDTIDARHFYPTLEAAIVAIQSRERA